MMCGLGAEGARMLMDRIRNEYTRGTAQVETFIALDWIQSDLRMCRRGNSAGKRRG